VCVCWLVGWLAETFFVDFLFLFQSQNPRPVDFRTLADALRFTKVFREIFAAHTTIGDDGLVALAAIFQLNAHVRSLALVGAKIGKTGTLALADALAMRNHGLRHLNLSRNSIGDTALSALIDALSDRPLRSLFLDSTSMGQKTVKTFATIASQLSWLETLRALDLSGNRIGSKGSQLLAPWLENVSALQALVLVKCDLDLEIIFESLSRNNPLQRLNVSGNRMSKKAATVAFFRYFAVVSLFAS
jgi:Leucine-rich repeat (LRR) protein